MANYDLIIFDCDGVLVDSEKITSIVFAQMLNELGINISIDEVNKQYVGITTIECITKVEEKFGIDVPSGFLEEYRQRFEVAMSSDLKAVAGVKGIINWLNSIEKNICVASSSDHKKIKLTLGLTGLLHYFEGNIFSAQDVARPKPYPDVFEYAAKLKEVDPSRCLVIEDTPTGVTAAVQANMPVIGYTGSFESNKLKQLGAMATIEHMKELRLYIS